MHVPILVETIVEYFKASFLRLPGNSPPHWMVDCTLGEGGHLHHLLRAFETEAGLKRHRFLAVDRDIGAVAQARVRFQREIAEGRVVIEHSLFGDLSALLKGMQIQGLLADLGFSSNQLDEPERGLSFAHDGPLDMRLDRSQGPSCFEYLQGVTEKELERVLREWGEERFSRRIASKLIELRRSGQLPRTTKELSRAVIDALPGFARHGRIHAATRTFQALRIEVNQELRQLDQLLEDVILKVIPGGRIAVLSFHSLEDRKVKMRFKDQNQFSIVTKKPIEASAEEIQRNPRARSAKLRVADRSDRK